jgi:hypothetical protein
MDGGHVVLARACILFFNSQITAEIELSTGKIAKGWEKIPKKCGERMCNLEQFFVIITSSDSRWILNYLKDSMSN